MISKHFLSQRLMYAPQNRVRGAYPKAYSTL
jgi:hypothetical protein